MAIPANWPQDLTALANRAMQKIGEPQVFTDIATDTTDNGITIQTCLYDVIRDAQTSFLWPELETLSVITTPDAAFTDTTAYDYSYRYSLPSDYLRPMNERLYDYRISGPYVYATVSSDLDFHYLKYSEDVTEWSPQLFKVILWRLSEEIVLPITMNEPKYAEIVIQRERAEDEARRIASYNRKFPNRRLHRQGGIARTRAGGYLNLSAALQGNG
jgi:hypothetical protein